MNAEELARSTYALLQLGDHVRLPKTTIAVLTEQFEAYAASETARADRAEQQSKVGLEAEAKDCLKALFALSGAKYPTPVEGYGTNSSWAISDLCRAVHEKEADLQRKDAALRGLLNLTDQGREGGLILSRADRKGITNGDQDVIDRAYIAAEAALAPISVPAAPEVTPSPCCANPNLVVKGVCERTEGRAGSKLHKKSLGCKSWRPTHNVCLNCGKEEPV